MATEQRMHSDLAIPPGEYLLEVLEEAGMPQAELARRMGRPTQAVNEIANGVKAITPETAIQLEQVVGVPAHIWTSLESEFQLVKARQRDNDGLDGEISLASEYPYNELSKQGFVPKTQKRLERVRALRRFFGVASLTFVERLDVYKAAFRTKMTARKLRAVRAAWLRAGVLIAGELDVSPFDRRELKKIVPELRRLTMANTGQLAGELRSIFARSGIAFVLMRHFKGSGVNGATFWLSSDKAVLMMSIRGRWADIFWFTLFHEVGHILLHGKRAIFVDTDRNQEPDGDWMVQEEEANQFARNTLIPPRAFSRFIETEDFSMDAIREFSESVEIHPGIVVGRLKNDEYLEPYELNEMQDRYQWGDDPE